MYPSIRHCNQSFKEKMIKEPILKKKKKLSSQKRPKSGDGGAKFAILQSFTA